MAALVVVAPEDLRAMIREELRALSAPPVSTLLDRKGLAAVLGVSLAQVDRLGREGLPCLRVGEVRRFELEHVLAWLRERGTR